MTLKHGVPSKQDQYAKRNVKSLEKEMRQHHVPLKTRLQWHSRVFGGKDGLTSEDIYKISQGKSKPHVYIFPYVKHAPPEVNRILEETYRRHRRAHQPLIDKGKMTERQSKISSGIAAWNNVRKAGYRKIMKTVAAWEKPKSHAHADAMHAALQYATRPIHRSIHLLKPKPDLRPGWNGDYVDTLHLMSNQNAKFPHVRQLMHRMSNLIDEAKRAGHNPFVPLNMPDGFFPDFHSVNRNTVTHAIRQNKTKEQRDRAWDNVRHRAMKHYALTSGRPTSRADRRRTSDLASSYLHQHHLLEHAHKTNNSNLIEDAHAKLSHLASVAKAHGRGYPALPAHGKYIPVEFRTHELENKIRKAFRANTSDRNRNKVWARVARLFKDHEVRPSGPPAVGESVINKQHTGMDTAQHRKFMQNVAVALPIAAGRTPHFLGNRVPGELNLGPTGTRSVVGKHQMNAEDFTGFSPARFSLRKPILTYGIESDIKEVSRAKKAVTKATRAVRTTRLKAPKSTVAKLQKKSSRLFNDVSKFVNKHKALTIGGATAAALFGDQIKTTPGYYFGTRAADRHKTMSDRKRMAMRFFPGYVDAFDEAVGRRKSKSFNKNWRGYDIRVQPYIYGLSYGMRDFFKTLKKDLPQVMSRGAFVHALNSIHQSVGLPPTTVDGIPIIRHTADKTFAPYTTAALVHAKNKLEQDNAHGQGNSTRHKAIDKLNQEIMLRSTLG